MPTLKSYPSTTKDCGRPLKANLTNSRGFTWVVAVSDLVVGGYKDSPGLLEKAASRCKKHSSVQLDSFLLRTFQRVIDLHGGCLTSTACRTKNPWIKAQIFTMKRTYLAVLKHLSDQKRALTVDEVLATIQIVMHVIERADVGTVVDQLLMPTDKNYLSRFLVIDDTFGRGKKEIKVPVQWMNETDLGIIVKSDSEYGVCSSEEQQLFKKFLSNFS